MVRGHGHPTTAPCNPELLFHKHDRGARRHASNDCTLGERGVDFLPVHAARPDNTTPGNHPGEAPSTWSTKVMRVEPGMERWRKARHDFRKRQIMTSETSIMAPSPAPGWRVHSCVVWVAVLVKVLVSGIANPRCSLEVLQVPRIVQKEWRVGLNIDDVRRKGLSGKERTFQEVGQTSHRPLGKKERVSLLCSSCGVGRLSPSTKKRTVPALVYSKL